MPIAVKGTAVGGPGGDPSYRPDRRRRQVVFRESDPGDVLHLVASGRPAVRATTRLGNVATLQLLGVGDAFGELALLDLAARRTT